MASTARTTVLAILLCPSDFGPLYRGDGAAQNNYAACHADREAPIGARNNGSFFLNSRVGYEDIPDGTSQTIFVGEKLRQGLDLGWASGTRATLRNAGIPINSPDLLYGKTQITMRDYDDDDQTETSLIPIDPDPHNPNLVGGFSSPHPGGANFAFGDGGVRYLRQSISASVFRRLANRADGEPIEDY
jgi:prepilin-type processing-associated H-X9-DG protein